MSSGRARGFRWRRLKAVQLLLYLVLRVVIMVVDMFSFEQAPQVARTLAWIIRLIDRKHARIAEKNLRLTPDLLPSHKIPRFIRKLYQHIGLGFVEMLMIPRLLQRHAIGRYVKVDRVEVVDRLLAEGRGVIVAIGHLGNWELAGIAVNLAGYRLNSLARPIENPWVDRYLNRFRTSTGQEIISKYHAVGAMVQTLKRNGLLVVQIDQDARHSGVFVKFFGRPASTHRSPAVLALKYGAPIVVAEIFRDGKMHRAVLSDPIRPDDYRGQADPVKALTQAYTTIFEGCVRRHPEQWFWVHDRWKTAERTARVDAAAVV